MIGSPESDLPPFEAEGGCLNVIVETPKGSRNKYGWDEQRGRFTLKGVLTAGAVFPFDFGFVPATLGGDGDPLDVLLLMDEPAFPGCHVPARLVGVIVAEQTEKDETTRNDRLIAVAEGSHAYRDVKALADLPKSLLDQIEHFFVSYNQIKGKEFRPQGRHGAREAERLVKAAHRRWKADRE